MRRLILCALVAAACGDNAGSRLPDDAGTSPARITGCLDMPGAAAAPADRLPCDLVPPGLQL